MLQITEERFTATGNTFRIYAELGSGLDVVISASNGGVNKPPICEESISQSFHSKLLPHALEYNKKWRYPQTLKT